MATNNARRLSLLSLLFATTSLAAISVAQAQDTDTEAATGEDAPKATQLDAVTSTATRNPTAINDVAGTVSVITAEELERRNANSMQDIVRYEPGVSVSNSPTRVGAGNFTIRGIGGNRVLVLVDGFTAPDYIDASAGGLYTRDFFDIDSMKRVEIIRGPSSALYGSDGLGGVVSYVTKDPADYLDLFGKDWYASLKGGYDSSDESFMESATGAVRAGNVEMLGLYTRRDGHEVEPNSSYTANPIDYESNSFLAKLVFNGPDSNKLTFTGQLDNKQADIRLLSEETGSVNRSEATDDTDRYFVSAAYSHQTPTPIADRMELKIGYTKLDRVEHTEQLRSGSTVRRVSDLHFNQEILSGDFQFGLTRNWAGIEHEFTYGVTADYTETSRPRYRTETNLLTNTTTNVVGFETFPNKNFPDTETVKAGVYVQDDIGIGRLNIIPALRFDYYSLDTKIDQMFLNSAGTNVPVDMTETEVSPKLGATFALTEEYKIFAQYAHGFRAPPYDSANYAWQHTAFGYEIIPNPDLKPETSDGFETGLRGKFRDGSSFSAAVFYNMYEDFIDQVFLGTAGAPPLMQFQYQNLSEVTIYGAEAKGEYRFLPEWALIGSLAYARGEDDQTGLPIDSVDPLKGILGLAYEGNGWGSQLMATHAWRDDRNATAGNFEAPSYTVVDFMAYYDMSEHLTVNAGVFNIFDEEYYYAQDVAGLASGSALTGRYAQPGRNFGVNATVRF